MASWSFFLRRVWFCGFVTTLAVLVSGLPCWAQEQQGAEQQVIQENQGRTAESSAQSAVQEKADLLILHVNDTHAYVAGQDESGNYCVHDAECRGGLARIAAAIKAARARGENVLALDAGDVFQGTLFFSVHRWPMLADLEQLMPFDAATLGNHEFDEGCAELEGYLAELPFPVLAANVSAQEDSPLARTNLRPYMIRTIGGHKVGVIGLGNDGLSILTSNCPGLRFTDREKEVKRAVKMLEARGVKRIVLLTHLGLPEDRKLARSLDGVDVIVGGHTHSYLGEGSEEGPYPVVERSPNGNPVLVVTAGCATRYLGELALKFNEQGVLVSWSGAARELSADQPRDPAVTARVASYAGALEVFRKKIVGHHEVRMNDGLNNCRKAECFSALLLADAMLEYGKDYSARIALVNSGSVRASLGPGDISQGDILNVFPFANSLVIREYSGEELLAALEHGVAGYDAEETGTKIGGPRMLQPAGLRYEVDEGKPKGSRVVRVEVQDNRGGFVPLQAVEKYRVVLADYLARGGDGYTMLARGKRVEAPDPIDSDLVTEYVKRHNPLPAPRTGRLKVVR